LGGSCGTAAGPPPPAALDHATVAAARYPLSAFDRRKSRLGRKLPSVTVDGYHISARALTHAIGIVASAKHWPATAAKTKQAAVALAVLDRLITVSGRRAHLVARSAVVARVRKIAHVFAHATPSALRAIHFRTPHGMAPATYVLRQLGEYQRIFTIERFRAAVEGTQHSAKRAARWLQQDLPHHSVRIQGLRLLKPLWAIVQSTGLVP
jgi:hypothetical protein